jgi:hypothetical protein
VTRLDAQGPRINAGESPWPDYLTAARALAQIKPAFAPGLESSR